MEESKPTLDQLAEQAARRQEAIDEVFLCAVSALLYHEKNQNAAEWTRLFGAIVDVCQKVGISREASRQADIDRGDAHHDAASY